MGLFGSAILSVKPPVTAALRGVNLTASRCRLPGRLPGNLGMTWPGYQY